MCHRYNDQRKRQETGNALFLILIAVALFAALSYAITQSSRGGGSIDRETQMVQLAQANQYVAQIQTALQKLLLTGGCDIVDISFENSSTSSYDYGTDACKVFHPDGGGVSNTTAAPDFATFPQWMINARTSVAGLGASGASGSDLVMMLAVPLQMCLDINNNIGIPNPSGAPPVDNTNVSLAYSNIANPYVGDFGNNALLDAAGVSGHYSGCFHHVAPSIAVNHYIYYNVLYVR